MTIPFVVIAAIFVLGMRLRALESARAAPDYRNTDGIGPGGVLYLLFMAVAVAFRYFG